MDGNNSLKLVDSTFRSGTSRTDTRTSDSTKWVKPEDVDQFRNEVGKVHNSLYSVCQIFSLTYLACAPPAKNFRR
jgi:hypothetical protein